MQSVLEGVALAIADSHDALLGSGGRIADVTLTGGGARSDLWARLIAAAIGLPLRVQRLNPMGSRRPARVEAA